MFLRAHCALKLKASPSIESDAFCADNNMLMTQSENQICIWDSTTEVCLASMECHDRTHDFDHANISHDGSKIVFISKLSTQYKVAYCTITN